MAKIKAGILSKVSGKVAGVVGGTWKGQNYIRELVKPANPNTALQQAQRGKMSFVVKTARQLVGDVLNPFLNKFCKTMSGYNWFCKENISKLSGTPLIFDSAPVLSFGTLGSGTFDTSDVNVQYGLQVKGLPAVAAGHTLKLIGVIIDQTGEVLDININNAPAIGAYTASGDFETPGTYRFYALAFFADFDANGVLQALSATSASGLETQTISA